MSNFPIRPENIISMTLTRISAIDVLLKQHYYPSIGFVELSLAEFAPIMNLHSGSQKWTVVWKDIRDVYAPAGWTVTNYNDSMGTTWLRFEKATNNKVVDAE